MFLKQLGGRQVSKHEKKKGHGGHQVVLKQLGGYQVSKQ
jgi:hypothetical protein